MIKDIRSIPVFRLLSGLLAGILLGNHIDGNPLIAVVLLLFLFGGSGLILFLKLIRKPGHEWINGTCILTFYVIFGFLVHFISDDNQKMSSGDIHGVFIAKVIDMPVRKEKSFRAEVELLRSEYVENALKSKSRSLIYFKNPDNQILPGLSEIIVFRGVLKIPEPPQNPGEFDYAGYLRSNKIGYTCFIDSGEWRKLGRDHKFSLMAFAMRVREKIWNQICDVSPGDANLDILYALGLGSKNLLDKETREAFIAAGTMHILAVSGLHVGLIYLIISQLLGFLRRFQSGTSLFFMSVILLLWFYALLTGMSPSVVRSVIMFSFFNIGKMIRRETSLYNAVFLAAFFSLLFLPHWLFEPGFQLSYSAVLAIIFFQPRIASLFSFRYKIFQWLWEITAVSISAQIGTVSISLFYFHRFPPYFLAANIIVIPLVTIILSVFVFQLLSLFIPFVFIILSKTVLFLIGILDFSVRTFQQLPSSGFNNIYFEREQMWLIILIVLFTAFFIRYRQNHWAILNIICLVFFLFCENVRIWKRNNTQHIVVYKVPQDFVVGMYDSGKGIIVVGTREPEETMNKLDYKCSGFHRKYSIYRTETIFLEDLERYHGDMIYTVKLPGRENYICWFMNKRILLLNDPGYYVGRRSCRLIETDILILGGDIRIQKETLFNHFTGKIVILSSSIPSFIGNENISSDFPYLIIDTRATGAWVNSFKTDNQFITKIKKYIKSLGNL